MEAVEKKIFKVPFLKPFNVVYHNIKAENQDVILKNKIKLQNTFLGDGILCVDKNRYQHIWYENSQNDYECEIINNIIVRNPNYERSVLTNVVQR